MIMEMTLMQKNFRAHFNVSHNIQKEIHVETFAGYITEVELTHIRVRFLLIELTDETVSNVNWVTRRLERGSYKLLNKPL